MAHVSGGFDYGTLQSVRHGNHDYGDRTSTTSSSNDRLERPIVVKCQFDRTFKRITFYSGCSFPLLRQRVCNVLN